jgi:CRISPR-associated protein Csy1
MQYKLQKAQQNKILGGMMNSELALHSEVGALKNLIEEFIQTRLQAKLDKLAGKDSKRQELIRDHIPETWIADAARRVKQIQLVSHAIKYQNPDAKGTNIYIVPESQTENNFVSTRTLNIKDRRDDVTGNAASLDVHKFLHLSHNEETLLKRIIRQDSNVRAAFPGTEQQKDEWLGAFSSITEASNEPATHACEATLFSSSRK